MTQIPRPGHKRIQQGRCEGRKPYGTKVGEDRGLQMILTLSAERLSTRQIAAALNAEGVPSRGGKAWTHGSVARLVRRVGADRRDAA